MRILIVAPVPPDPDGAGAIPILLHAQLSGLRERNELTFLSAVGDEMGEAAAAAGLHPGVEAHFADRRQPRTVTSRWRRRLRLASAWLRGTPWRAAWFADPDIQAVLDRLARECDFDVVVVEDSAMAGFRLPDGVPSLLTEHEVLRPRPVRWRPGSPASWPGWAFDELDWLRRPRFQRRAWRRFDRVLAFGNRDAEAIAELAPELGSRVRVSPFGLVLPPVADPEREEPDTVLFAGNFTHQPNRDAAHWLATEIAPALRRLRPGACLRLVGSSPPPSLLALAGPGVEVVADPARIDPYLDSAAIVIAPVRSGGGMRMKVLQALASGKAVVTTERGKEGFDCFDEEPPLRVAESAERIAHAAADLLGDEPARRELGRRAREFAERHHSPGAWAERLEATYREACEARGARADA